MFITNNTNNDGTVFGYVVRHFALLFVLFGTMLAAGVVASEEPSNNKEDTNLLQDLFEDILVLSSGLTLPSLKEIFEAYRAAKQRVDRKNWQYRLAECEKHPKCLIADDDGHINIFSSPDDSPFFWNNDCEKTFEPGFITTGIECRRLRADWNVVQFRTRCDTCNPDQEYCELIRDRPGWCMTKPPRPITEEEISWHLTCNTLGDGPLPKECIKRICDSWDKELDGEPLPDECK
jgi:hypothetical protein